MSLMAMANGYTGDAVAFEGVSAADLAKYDLVNGPITMAMEATQLLNEAFMDGVYAPNNMVMEAAMEGYSSVQESGKMASIKEKLKKAGSKIAEMFRKLGNAVKVFFSNVATKFKKKSNDAISEIKKLDVSEIKYKGPKYTHLEDIGKILKEGTPDVVFGKIRVFKAAVSGDLKKSKDNTVEASKYREEMDDALKDYKKTLGIKESDKTSDSVALAAYFRNDETEDVETEQKISSSEALKVLSAGSKAYADLNSISDKIKKDYDNYAKEVENMYNVADTVEANGTSDSGMPYTDASVWSGVALGVRNCQTFITAVVSAWGTAYGSAMAKYLAGAKAAANKSE